MLWPGFVATTHNKGIEFYQEGPDGLRLAASRPLADSRLVRGDVNGDGTVDLIAGGWYCEPWQEIFVNDPPAFDAPVRTPREFFPEAAGDLDLDGYADVVMGARVLWGPDLEEVTELPTAQARTFVADIDNDGDPDVIVGAPGGLATTFVIRNLGSREFDLVEAAEGGPTAVVDVGGDGQIEVLVAQGGPEDDSGNDPYSVFHRWTGERLEAIEGSSWVGGDRGLTADLDLDGVPELVTTGGWDDTRVYEMWDYQASELALDVPRLDTIGVGDFDADGDPDLAGLANAVGEGPLYVLRNVTSHP